MRLARLSDDRPEDEQLLAQTRARRGRSLLGRERVSRWGEAAVFLAVAGGFVLAAPARHGVSVGVLLGFVAIYAAASRIEFEIAAGSAIPTQLVFIPMLFVVPARLVPLVVAAGLLVGHVPDLLRSVHGERILSPIGNATYAVGPALVMLAAGEPRATAAALPVLAAAIAVQFAGDFALTAVREWTALAVPPRRLVRPFAWIMMVDALLTPVGFAFAVESRRWPLAVVSALPLLLLLRFFANERTARVDHMLELSNAYRGTAFLLGDVVEADDEYTGSHSRGVVDLVLGVCGLMGLDEAALRRAEFAALLHDVGKIRIDKAIINKPGPLTPAERRIVEQHTIEGERMLLPIGGLLAEVGTIVRSCHERWDGRGYPDGLVGESIPLLARIVCCCDAFSAMTTDRPYRRARSFADAVDELHRSSGTHFDPQVVDAITALVGTGQVELAAAA